MSGWAKKRFWKETTVEDEGEGFGVRLDGRAVKTPAKAALIVPTRAMAEAIAAEWDAQEAEINPTAMPTTRGANAAIDKVRIQHGEVADMLAEYGNSDLLCYRAAQPQELIARQAEAWDPLLERAAKELSASLRPLSGIMHVDQDARSLAELRKRVHALNEFELAAFHDLVSLSGSLVIGFAAVHGWAPIDELWDVSRIDETWQEEQWGVDEEAQAQAAIKKEAFLHADRFFAMAR
ncbi:MULTISPECIES: ATP12 family chaperone protein [Shimia]|uniref:ATP12 family chaperone protein n=1 Tax=Shimia TaxID=573139 RepID=UPI001FB46356|nr:MULTISPECIES: ATP12 family protein [Shimia]MDV4143229.1 ATP12 family protein [Shimia sp. FJ5]